MKYPVAVREREIDFGDSVLKAKTFRKIQSSSRLVDQRYKKSSGLIMRDSSVTLSGLRLLREL